MINLGGKIVESGLRGPSAMDFAVKNFGKSSKGLSIGYLTEIF